MKQIFDYDGNIHMVCRWSQELLGYNFTVLHRPERMMRDVDALSRFYNGLIATYEERLAALQTKSRRNYPESYTASDLSTLTKNGCLAPLPSSTTLAVSATKVSLMLSGSGMVISSCPPAVATESPPASRDKPEVAVRIARSRTLTWASINSTFGSLASSLLNPTFAFDLVFFEESAALAGVLRRLHPSSTVICSQFMPHIAREIDPLFPSVVHGIDLHCRQSTRVEQMVWVGRSCQQIHRLGSTHHLHAFCLVAPTVDADYLCDAGHELTIAVQHQFASSTWAVKCGVTFASLFGDATVSPRWISLGYRQRFGAPPVSPRFPSGVEFIRPFGDCVDSRFNNRLFIVSALSELREHPQAGDAINHVAASPRALAFAQMSDVTGLSARSCFVLDPDFPGHDHGGESGSFPFSFGLPFTDNFGITCIRAAQPVELLDMYSMPAPMIDRLDALDHRQLARHLCYSLPFSLASALGSAIVADCFMKIFLDDGIVDDICRCLITKPLPLDSEWEPAYQADLDTRRMMSKLASGQEWTDKEVNSLHSAYRQPIRDSLIRYEHRRLVYYRPIEYSTRFLLLIIVPNSDLRRTLFVAYHATPAAGHMGRYKTLYRLRIRFFWPGMRAFIEDAVKSCAHCIAANSRKRPASELQFSWPVDSPFCIIHVDLWVPGRLEDYQGNSYLMNAMDDMTGFVVSVPVSAVHAHTLAKEFMQHVLLKVGFCAMVVADDGSNFKGIFADMCKLLNIRLHPLAKGNHKALSVERYHRYLNKAVTIAANDRETNEVFVAAGMVAAYAWNSSPIDGTDIIRSVPAIGREFKFPMDFELSPLPSLSDDVAGALHTYLSRVASNVSFATEILKLLVEDRRTAHRERVNSGRTRVEYQVGDLVTARIQVQSRAADGRSSKLLYKARGPFEIVEVVGHGSYRLKSFGRPDAATRVHHSEDLFLLPPSLRPCDPLDTPDLRFLNHSHAPSLHPLKKVLDIDLYNEVWFDSTLVTKAPTRLAPSQRWPSLASDPVESVASRVPLGSLPADEIVVCAEDSIEEHVLPSVPTDFPGALRASRDRLAFISYTPADTMRPRWYLVQVDLESSKRHPEIIACDRERLFYVEFYAKHPSDEEICDASARWWREWHEYTRDPATNEIMYGQRVLFRPNDALTQVGSSSMPKWWTLATQSCF
ncbi:MAG: hypothetical protein ACREOZ_03790 [Gloeomargaritales cyanobacterium]